MCNVYYSLKLAGVTEGKRKTRSCARRVFENGSLRDDGVFSLDNFEKVVTVCLHCARDISKQLDDTSEPSYARVSRPLVNFTFLSLSRSFSLSLVLYVPTAKKHSKRASYSI